MGVAGVQAFFSIEGGKEEKSELVVVLLLLLLLHHLLSNEKKKTHLGDVDRQGAGLVEVRGRRAAGVAGLDGAVSDGERRGDGGEEAEGALVGRGRGRGRGSGSLGCFFAFFFSNLRSEVWESEKCFCYFFF